MVDTINPNTNQPDNWNNNQNTTPEPVPSTEATDRFYGGFDRPDEVKINLTPTDNAPGVSSPPQPQDLSTPASGAPTAPAQPVQDVAPVAPAEVKHTTYVNPADRINWRGIIVIAVIGLVVAVLLGGGIYLGLSASNKSKIEEQEAELEDLNRELASLEETPDPLELPAVETPEVPVVETPTTPVIAPVVVPTETPVEVDDRQPDAETDKLG